MATSKVTFVTGTAEVKRRDPQGLNSLHPDQHLTTEPQKPLQVTYVDGKCTCCPYGYHIDLDFLNFCRDLESGSTLRNLKRIRRNKKKLRKSMELMLDEQEGRTFDPSSAPPDIVHSTEAGRLMHMINYERSATHHILSQIDSSVNTTIANIDGVRGRRYMSSDSDEPVTPFSPSSYRAAYSNDGAMTPPLSMSARTDSLTSLSSVSTMSSESHLMQQLYPQEFQYTVNHKVTSKIIETPVIEMATAEVKLKETPVIERGTAEVKPKETPVVERGTAEVKHYSTTSSAQLAGPSEVFEPVFSPKVFSPGNTKIPPNTLPPANPLTPAVKETLALNAQRIKELEDQVKTIPILQVRISVLKEEKRLLNLQLKASKSNSHPPMISIGVGDNRIEVDEKVEKLVYSPKQFELPKSFTDSTQSLRSPLAKTPPATLPKPVKTTSTGVGDHSVIEPYLLQPELPTGYTIEDNVTHTEIHTTTVIERDRLLKSFIQPPSLNVSFHRTTSQESIDRETRLPSSSQLESPRFTINQIQRSTPKALTRTLGVGEGNVFEDSGLHVHEKELRTVIIGQSGAVAKRNVGIDCRVPTRDVGVSFMCDEEKPATRTIGVNVSYDTSGILTSLDFKGETELRMALRGVLQRSVHSVGTNCNFKVTTIDAATLTETGSGVSVGCGDEEMRIDVEVRPATVKKSQGVTVKPECLPKCVSTEKDWVLDASTNTFMIDQYHKACMTDKQKCIMAATNTEPLPYRHSSIQTDLNVFMSSAQIKHAVTNTEQPTTYSTAMCTDLVIGLDSATNTESIPRSNVAVNTTEKVSQLFQQATVEKKAPELKSILKKPQHVDKSVGDNVADEEPYSFSEITEVITPITRVSTAKLENVQKAATETSKYISQSNSVGRSGSDERDVHISSYELSRRSSAPVTLVGKQSESLETNTMTMNSSFKQVSPRRSDDSFQETVTEHYIITKDGKKLISEEKTTTSSRGGHSSSVNHYTGNASIEGRSSLTDASIIHSNNDISTTEPKSSLDGHNTHKYSGSSKVEKIHINLMTNPYRTLENLSEVSALVDSQPDEIDSNSVSISKTSSDGNLYSERTSLNETKSVDTIFDMRRAGSVEDFMPDDIKKYMSIETNLTKDSGFGEDLQSRFSGNLVSSSEGLSSGGASRSVKLSKTITTTSTSKSGDTVIVQETKTVEGPDGKSVTTVTETTKDGLKIVQQYDNALQGPHSNFFSSNGATENEMSSSTYSSSYSSSRTDDSDVSVDQDTDSYTQISTDSDMTTSSGNYGSLDRATGKLKSIMKQSKSEAERRDKKTGIRFAESVTGGTGSSSEEDDDTSDSDSTTSFDEGSYDSQQGEVVYKCKDDEVIAQGRPGAQMFDQNIRETYELSEEVREACTVLAAYLIDSTDIQTKQLNACQNIVQQEWFRVSSMKLSSAHQVEDFLSSVNEISKSLLKYIVNMTDSNGNTAIHYCISHCNFEIASLLLDSEVCDNNKQNKAGYTPIMLAGLASIQNTDQLEVVRRIFSTGDINARASETQQTALMLAASHGKTEMVKLLVEEGAEINLQDVDGSTALMCACEHGHLEIVNFLLSQPNIDAKITDNENSTALSIAMEAGHKDVGVVLYKHLNFSKPTSPRPARGYHKKRKSSSSPTPSSFEIH
ncbi:KN motif and ankyrin repeat domain-containing protein 1-like isoform X1 [Biomphalaria glabrata]